MIQDRRKQWQKDCINYSWSRCGSVATARGDNSPTRLKRIDAMLDADNHQASFTWYNEELSARHVDRLPVQYKGAA